MPIQWPGPFGPTGKKHPKEFEDLDPDFVEIWGPPPIDKLETGVSLSRYRTALAGWGGVVDFGELKPDDEHLIEQWDLGDPMFYRGRYNVRVAFPDAPYNPIRNWSTRYFKAGVFSIKPLIASYHTRSVLAGYFVDPLHPVVAPWVVLRNEDNRKKLQEALDQE